MTILSIILNLSEHVLLPYGDIGEPELRVRLPGRLGSGEVAVGQGIRAAVPLHDSDPYQWWTACHVAGDRLLRCRIVRTKISDRWAFTAQLILDGHPLQRYETGAELVGVDVDPSEIAVVGNTGAYKERFCAELADYDREIRRLQRRLDRQHSAGSPGRFDEQGRHRKGGCDWKNRSKRAQQTSVNLTDARRRLAAHRKSLHGNLANRILGQGVTVKAEKVSYKAFQRSCGRKERKPSASGPTAAAAGSWLTGMCSAGSWSATSIPTPLTHTPLGR